MKDRHTDDDAQLAAMGHKAELQRNYSMLWVTRMRCNTQILY